MSQWRYYGATGTGYAIGFDTSALVAALTNGGWQQMHEMQYNERKSAAAIEGIIAFAAAQINASVGDNEDENQQLAQEAAIFVLTRMATEIVPSTKAPLFKEEKEWRVVCFTRVASHERLNFRVHAGNIIPYLLISLHTKEGRLPIRRVIHGPVLDPQLNRAALKRLLESNGYSSVEVGGSNIPMRA